MIFSRAPVAVVAHPDPECPDPMFGPRTFLGEFGNDTVSLSLTDLGVHTGVQIDFDLYLIRTWDGSRIAAAGRRIHRLLWARRTCHEKRSENMLAPTPA